MIKMQTACINSYPSSNIWIYEINEFMAWFSSFYIPFPKIYQSSVNTEKGNGNFRTLYFAFLDTVDRVSVFLTTFQETSFKDFFIKMQFENSILLMWKIWTARIFMKNNKECKPL